MLSMYTSYATESRLSLNILTAGKICSAIVNKPASGGVQPLQCTGTEPGLLLLMEKALKVKVTVVSVIKIASDWHKNEPC